jgi:nicotinamidase-related amidase
VNASVETGARAAEALLAPEESALLLIDYQPQMLFAAQSMDGQTLVNNVVALAKGAKAFGVPTVLSTVSAGTFSGPTFPQLTAVFPELEQVDRTTMNPWEDANFVAAVEETGRSRLVVGGLWTEVCVVFPVLSALEAGYEVFVVVDASASTTEAAQEAAVQRMVAAGAVPVTWMQVVLEWQRDWARTETAKAVGDIMKEHGGIYGQGISYYYSVAPHSPVAAG